MKQSIRFWYACGIALCSYAAISPAQALPVPDATLPNNSIVTNQNNISTITGGTRAGTNLFHSFSEFSVPTLGVAHFNNALEIQNIISRVTGRSISNIDGLIQANGKANLFLINPNGIILDRNASLSIGGSFVASTASSLKFADGTQFSATALSTKPLLTISVPIGLQFGANPGSIVNRSQVTDSNGNTVGLQVDTGKSLALVGGNVRLYGGSLTAPGGRVELGGLSAAGTVGLNSDGSLSYPEQVQRADVSLINGAKVNVTAGGGGSIAINARNLNLEGDQNSTLAGESKLLAGIASGLGSVNSQAGDIDINATGAVTLNNGSFISNSVLSGGKGKGGDVNITTDSLLGTNGSEVYADTSGQGDAGSVTINASGPVKLDGVDSNGFLSGAFSQVLSGAVGKAGGVNVTAGSLSLTNGAQISSSTFAQGNAGSVTINASGPVKLDGAVLDGEGNVFPSGAYSQVNTGGIGKGGNVNVTAGSLSLTNGAELSTNVQQNGNGDAGSVAIHTSGLVSLDGVSNGSSSGAFSRVLSGAKGKGGEINVTAGSLSQLMARC